MKNSPSIAITSAVFGCIAGCLALEHGIHEILQGNISTGALRFNANGAACVPEQVWHFCQPAMSWIKNYQLTGILAVTIGLAVVLWSIFGNTTRYSGPMLIILNLALMNLGGGFIGPIIGITGGVVGSCAGQIPAEQSQPQRFVALIGRLYPGALIAYVTWIMLQWILGTVANDMMIRLSNLALVVDVLLIYFAVHSAFVHRRLGTTG